MLSPHSPPLLFILPPLKLIKPILMKKSINKAHINGFINSDSPIINDAKMIYQLPYLYICINGRGLSCSWQRLRATAVLVLREKFFAYLLPFSIGGAGCNAA
jgi:hypothetical protein